MVEIMYKGRSVMHIGPPFYWPLTADGRNI